MPALPLLAAQAASKTSRPAAEDERPARVLLTAGRKADRAVDSQVLSALSGPKGKTRFAAIRSAGLLRVKGAKARLEQLAGSADLHERALAVEALARSGNPGPAVAACRSGVASGCSALQWSDPDLSEAALRAALAGPQPLARASAAFALARIGRVQGVAQVARELLKHTEPAVRVEAAQAAAALGDRSLTEDLRLAKAAETDELAAQVIESALARLEARP